MCRKVASIFALVHLASSSKSDKMAISCDKYNRCWWNFLTVALDINLSTIVYVPNLFKNFKSSMPRPKTYINEGVIKPEIYLKS